jgi:hypothetical protein
MTLEADRLEKRRDLLAKVDRFQKAAEGQANGSARNVSVYQRKAFELMTSPAAKKAFDITEENDKLRDEYGRNSLGQRGRGAKRALSQGATADLQDWFAGMIPVIVGFAKLQ